jgi:hypothetical protein
MLHASVKEEKELPLLGVHPNYCERNFLVDIKNTMCLWMPSLLKGNLRTHLHGFYELVCHPDTIGGYNAKERTDLLSNAISNNRNSMPTEKAKQVMEIVNVLQRIDAEIESGHIGNQPLATDPFDTKSLLLTDKE